MNQTRHILWKTIVKPFYRENTGFFFFFFFVFFGVIAPSQQLAYHYALIRGMLDSTTILVLVLFAWTLYAVKCSSWITGNIERAENEFLRWIAVKGRKDLFLCWLEVQVYLFLPVLLYALCVIGIAIIKGAWASATAVLVYTVSVCIATAALYYRLTFPLKTGRWRHIVRLRSRRSKPHYWCFLLRYYWAENKLLLSAIKLSGCIILYLLLQDLSPSTYDIRMPYLFYSMILFGHGILIYRTRNMEESRLLFYRSLPVSILQRWLQYVMLYFLLLLPECITLGWLLPVHIQLKDALGFLLSAYSVLLLLNSCLFIAQMKRSEFLQLCLVVFGILYFGVLSDTLIYLSGLFFVTAGSLFFGRYWEEQRTIRELKS